MTRALFSALTLVTAASATSEPLMNGEVCPSGAEWDGVEITNCGSNCDANQCVVNDFNDPLTTVSCTCLPAVGDACYNTEGIYGALGLTIMDNCAVDDCDCEYTEVIPTSGNIGRLECGCATNGPDATPAPTTTETPAPSTTEAPTPAPYVPPYPDCERAYDDNDYCICPRPRPYPEDPKMQEVSGCGDATYLLPADVAVCSGPTDKEPAGTACPKQGDTTTIACRSEILSYLTGGSTGECKAPEDAECVQLNTGVWGCVFPGNCNTVNTCTKEPTCNDGYEKNDDGTCKVADNGYPVADKNNKTSLYDTAKLTKLQADADSEDSDGASSVALSLTASLVAVVAIYF